MHGYRFKSQTHALRAIADWISFYNGQRPQLVGHYISSGHSGAWQLGINLVEGINNKIKVIKRAA